MLHVNMQQLQAATRNFYDATGIKVVLYDDKREFVYSYPEDMVPFCSAVRLSKRLTQRCLQCDKRGFDECDRIGGVVVYQCHMGLSEAISPIQDNGVTVGYMMLGGVLDEGNHPLCRQRIDELPHTLDALKEQLYGELDTLPVKTGDAIRAAARLLEMCVCYLWYNQIIEARSGSLVQHLNRYIQAHLSGDVSVAALCRYLCISRSVLYQLSKEHFGMGISDYVRRVRLERAMQLLHEGTLRVAEVAAAVGLPDANYFTKQIKRYVGVTPSALLKHARAGAVDKNTGNI